MQLFGEIRKNHHNVKADEHRKPRTVDLYLEDTHPRRFAAFF
jgi:hypothetical protein